MTSPLVQSSADQGSLHRTVIPPAAILLVDDQPARLLTYQAILSNLNVECVCVHSGFEALERLLWQEFAAIVLDVSMPAMDGFETARRIREHPRVGGTPIIFVTGIHVSDFERLKGYEVGAIDYIAVPIVPEILRSKVAILVELYQRRGELQMLNRALEEARERLAMEHAKAVADSELHRRAVFEHPSERTIVLEAARDAGGVIVDWTYRNANGNALKMLGESLATLIGKRVSDFFDAERAARANAICTRVLNSGEATHYESDFGNRDFLVTIFPIGKDCVVSSGIDITARKLAERALRDSEQRFALAKAAARLGIYDWNITAGKLQWDERTHELWGLSAAREPTYELFLGAVHADDRESTHRAVERSLDPTGDGRYFASFRVIGHETGALRWIEATGQVTFVSGCATRLVGTVQDTTDRRSAEDSLRESESRFRELANTIDQFAWTCDELGRAIWYNDRWYAYTGTSFETLRADGLGGILHPGHIERVLAHFQQCLHSGTPWEDTFPLRGADGEYRWFLSRAIPVRDAHEKVVRWFGTNTDVTELRRLQDALKETDRRKDEFLAMLAHELRNPVAPIRNAAEVLARSAHEPQYQALAAIVQRQTAQLARLLDDLLDVARISRGRIELRQEVISLQTCIDLAIETIEPLMREKGHELVVEHAPQPLIVRADRARLTQCIANLLSNAAKYTNTRGTIRIQTYTSGTEAVIEVADNGIGIPAEFMPRVFELFAQSERSLDRSQGGLGIGLSICKQLIEMHGGRVTAHSEGSQRGAKFALRLPLIASAVPDASQGQPQSASHYEILIVDDNKDAADTLGMLLRFAGHQVATAYSGEEALERIAAHPPQIIFLDIGLPLMDGYEVARRIRLTNGDIRLIALSGYGQAADRERSRSAGFDAHLVKPVDMATIEQTLAG